MNNAGLFWIVIELTTLVSTFLVAFERAAESIEAAWKYIIVVSGGISLALFGTVLFYWAGSLVIGPSYDMTWAALHSAAPHMNPTLVTLAFLLVLIGYGTKVGLAPMHTWLPDAHSEGPTPVSALLSGALLNTAMVGIIRYVAVVDATGAGLLPRITLVTLGIVSLVVAALFIVRQEGVKRLMALAGWRRRHHRRTAVRSVCQRADNPPGGAGNEGRLGGFCHGCPADHHLHRLLESLPNYVLRDAGA